MLSSPTKLAWVKLALAVIALTIVFVAMRYLNGVGSTDVPVEAASDDAGTPTSMPAGVSGNAVAPEDSSPSSSVSNEGSSAGSGAVLPAETPDYSRLGEGDQGREAPGEVADNAAGSEVSPGAVSGEAANGGVAQAPGSQVQVVSPMSPEASGSGYIGPAPEAYDTGDVGPAPEAGSPLGDNAMPVDPSASGPGAVGGGVPTIPPEYSDPGIPLEGPDSDPQPEQ